MKFRMLMFVLNKISSSAAVDFAVAVMVDVNARASTRIAAIRWLFENGWASE